MQKEDEEYPLIGEPEVRHVGDRNTQSSQYTNRRVAFMTTVLLLLVSILVLSVGEFKFETNRSGSIELESTSIRWSLKRQGYDPLSYFLTDNLHLKYSFLNDYDAIVEPYAPMYLYVSDISSLQSSYSKLSFTVCPEDTSVSYGSGCQSGIYSLKADKSSLFTTGCAPPHVFSVNIYADSDEPLHSFRAVCMYVRREIRSLSDQDLNATMDAMAVMWNTPQTVGKMLYGNDFNNITYFTLAHYFGASHREADHIHEGVGMYEMISDFIDVIWACCGRFLAAALEIVKCIREVDASSGQLRLTSLLGFHHRHGFTRLFYFPTEHLRHFKLPCHWRNVLGKKQVS